VALAKASLGAAGRFVLPENFSAQPLDRALRSLVGDESWSKIRRFIASGKVRVDGVPVVDATLRVQRGQEIEFVPNAPRASEQRLPSDTIVFADAQVVVVHKPAGMSTVPFDENERDTLDELVSRLLAKREGARRSPLGIVHRLDKDTTGLVLFARTLAAKRHLKNQFRFHQVRRRYWAFVHGSLASTTFSSRLVPDRGDGRRGSTENPILGREATTHVKKLEALEGATWIECRLETGRTHQIRIHLSEAGHPLLGERVYGRDAPRRNVEVPRIMLHAFELGFEHPTSGRPLDFSSPMPEDMKRVLARLRRAGVEAPRDEPSGKVGDQRDHSRKDGRADRAGSAKNRR
jgi:23S rRNA pseudouridine1911/1915/1917 synthase